MRRLSLPVLLAICAGAVALLDGCAGPQVLGGSADGVWVKVPVLGVGSPDAAAQAHCGRFGKTAVRASELTGDYGDWRQPAERASHLPIYAYDCK